MKGFSLARSIRPALAVGLVCLSLAGIAQETPPPITRVPPPAIAPPHLGAAISSHEALTNLEFNSLVQVYNAQLGEAEAKFTFIMTNVSDAPVHILNISATCICTKAIMPRTPWIILPHTTEELHAVMQLVNKPPGENTKNLIISSTNGVKTLSVQANIPTPPAQMSAADRQKNQELAKADRQAVFKNDCAQCHATPTVGKAGKELYDTACGICHDSDHRASAVMDLGSLNHPVDAEFWASMIAKGMISGKPATMMPAFAHDQGGPLTKEQIQSLVTYLMTDFPQTHKPTPQVKLPEAVPPPAGQAPHAATRPIPLPPPQVNTAAPKAPAAQPEIK